MSQRHFLTKIKKAIPESIQIIIGLIVAAIVGFSAIGLATWAFYCIGSSIFTIDTTPITIPIFELEISKGSLNLAVISFSLSCFIIVFVPSIVIWAYVMRR